MIEHREAADVAGVAERPDIAGYGESTDYGTGVTRPRPQRDRLDTS